MQPHAARSGRDILRSFLELHFLPLRLAISQLKFWDGNTVTYYTAVDGPGNPDT